MPGAARLGDLAQVYADAHGSLCCPHPAVGPIVMGSPNVNVNGRPAARLDDIGIHAVCCGPNLFKVAKGSSTVYVNGKPIARLNDKTQHCGGSGPIILASNDVLIDDGAEAESLLAKILKLLKKLAKEAEKAFKGGKKKKAAKTKFPPTVPTKGATPPPGKKTKPGQEKKPKEKHFAAGKFVDEDGNPMHGLELIVKIDGKDTVVTADHEGVVKIEHIPAGGITAKLKPGSSLGSPPAGGTKPSGGAGGAGGAGGTKPPSGAGPSTKPGTSGGTTKPGTSGGTTKPGTSGGTTKPGTSGGTTQPPGEKKEAKPGEKKPEDKKPEDKKPEDKKPEEKKPEDKKPEDKKPEEKKPEDKKPEDKKPEEKKPEDEKDPEIEALDLSPKAKKAAYELKKKHPDVKFTSGRRDKAGQAHAMASNVVHNRTWIKETYRDSPARKACQKWVDEHPEATTQSAITAGLLEVLNGFDDDGVARLSKHLNGDAFDVQPVEGATGEEIKKTLRALTPPPALFLDKEGGLVRWHAQF